MKKWLALILAAVMCFSLAACGGSGDAKEDEKTTLADEAGTVEQTVDKVSEAMDLINGIGEVSLESKTKIDEAQKAYKALSSEEKAKVSNYSVLEAAVSKYDGLAKVEKDKALKQFESKFNVEYDKVEGISWYMPKNMPDYIDERSYIIPYIGVQNNNMWICVRYNYTDDDWIFWESLTIVVDGEKTVKYVGGLNTVRDNGGGEVWEWYDDALDKNAPMDSKEIQNLNKIVTSDETIIRFQGDEYHYDLTVSFEDKTMIKNVLDLYSAYTKY